MNEPVRTLTINGRTVDQCGRALLLAAQAVIAEEIEHAERVARLSCPVPGRPCPAPPCTDHPNCNGPRRIKPCRL